MADRDGIFFPLLSDFWPHGAVASAYGAFDEISGGARRSSYLIDKAGVVRGRCTARRSEARDLDAHAEALKRLRSLGRWWHANRAGTTTGLVLSGDFARSGLEGRERCGTLVHVAPLVTRDASGATFCVSRVCRVVRARSGHQRAHSSAVEHLAYNEVVAGSIPAAPTPDPLDFADSSGHTRPYPCRHDLGHLRQPLATAASRRPVATAALAQYPSVPRAAAVEEPARSFPPLVSARRCLRGLVVARALGRDPPRLLRAWRTA